MTHACCPACRLRIHATVADAEPCPGCGEPLTAAPAADVLGLRLFQVGDETVASLALPLPGERL